MVDVATEAPAAEAVPAATGKKRARDETATAPIADELQLPAASIMRIVKSKLPANMNVAAETRKAGDRRSARGG